MTTERLSMVSATYTIQIGSSSSTAAPWTPTVSVESSPLPESGSRRLAPLSYVDQAYYWTHVWQMGERESLRELAAGEGRVFGDPADAVRYLLSHDE
jgi:hypothetical protein